MRFEDRSSDLPRRGLFTLALRSTGLGILAVAVAGCRGVPAAGLLKPTIRPPAGDAAVAPLAQDAVATLLSRHVDSGVRPVSHVERAEPLPPVRRRVCFVGVQTESTEPDPVLEEQVRDAIEGRIAQAQAFQPVDRALVQAALDDARLLPGQVFIPEHLRGVAAHLERQGHPIDYLLLATITSGSGRAGRRLVLDLAAADGGGRDTQSADLGPGRSLGPAAWFMRPPVTGK